MMENRVYLWLAVAVWVAIGSLSSSAQAKPGEIYRCPAADGSVQFQELPCAGQRAADQVAGDTSDQAALRRWLRNVSGGADRGYVGSGQSTRGNRAPSIRSSNQTQQPVRLTERLISRPSNEEAIAACSWRFLQCANGDGPAMDQCVQSIPRCGERQNGACCQEAFVRRYSQLRAAGATRQQATREALLGR